MALKNFLAKIHWLDEKYFLQEYEEVRAVLYFEDDVSSYWGVIIQGASALSSTGEQMVNITFFVPEKIKKKFNKNELFFICNPMEKLLIAEGKFVS